MELRIWETRRAKQFLSPLKLLARCILYKAVGYISAADVAYNKKCVAKFIIKLQRNGNEIFDANNQYYEISVVREAFLEMIMIGKLENRSCNI